MTFSRNVAFEYVPWQCDGLVGLLSFENLTSGTRWSGSINSYFQIHFGPAPLLRVRQGLVRFCDGLARHYSTPLCSTAAAVALEKERLCIKATGDPSNRWRIHWSDDAAGTRGTTTTTFYYTTTAATAVFWESSTRTTP